MAARWRARVTSRLLLATAAAVALFLTVAVPAAGGGSAGWSAAAYQKPSHRGYPWHRRVIAARRFARRRAGTVSFAVVGERGRLRGLRPRRGFHSASVVKVMLMVAYLRRMGVRHRRLRAADRRLLGPMIRRSANGPASTVYGLVGSDALRRLARAARMRHFQTSPTWGLTWINARDQALFMYRLRRYIPTRHRHYAFHLLSSIVSWQRWGIPRARLRGWRLYFKGGFVPAAGGWWIHQVARLRRGDRRLGVAVLTRGDPSLHYGAETVRGVVARLLRRYNAFHR